MNKEALEKLRDSVAKRDPEYFDQNCVPMMGIHSEVMNGHPRGCVMQDALELFATQATCMDAIFKDVLRINQKEEKWIFSYVVDIERVAIASGLTVPESFGPKDAAARIQQVIDGIFR